MNTEVLKSIYKSIRGNIGLLTENDEIIKNILGTDLTIVEVKGKQFLLVPLNSKHKFNYYEDGLDVDGQLEIKDLNRVPTRMEFMLYDTGSKDYALDANGHITTNTAGHPALTFQANSAIVADDPHVNFFSQIDQMIEALEVGSYRPGGTSVYDSSMRNPGVQNALLVFDHLADHVNKIHTKNGSQGNAFTYSIERTETLIVQAKTLRSETIDTDFAEAYLQFSTLSLNYQAMLSSIGKITQLSLVNYL